MLNRAGGGARALGAYRNESPLTTARLIVEGLTQAGGEGCEGVEMAPEQLNLLRWGSRPAKPHGLLTLFFPAASLAKRAKPHPLVSRVSLQVEFVLPASLGPTHHPPATRHSMATNCWISVPLILTHFPPSLPHPTQPPTAILTRPGRPSRLRSTRLSCVVGHLSPARCCLCPEREGVRRRATSSGLGRISFQPKRRILTPSGISPPSTPPVL